jgi:CO/xanthine dehydrogenase FAD-binding subunit
MIIEYHRPDNLAGALSLLARTEPLTVPLGGGSALNRPSAQSLAVVDLQALGLGGYRLVGHTLELGATLTLDALLAAAGEKSGQSPPEPLSLQPALIQVLRLEATYNLRQVATVAGSLAAADGRSPWAVAMLSLDAQLNLYRSGSTELETLSLGDFLPLREGDLRSSLITQVVLPLNVHLAYEYVARTPADWPLVCVGVARWPSGRTRLALGGFGSSPLLAMDGPSPDGVDLAAADAYSQAGDAWATAEYRREMAAVLAARALPRLLEPSA